MHRLPRRKDAWIPSFVKDPRLQPKKNEKIVRHVRGIFNKITPITYNDLAREFINLKIYENEEVLPTIVDLFFKKAWTEPVFVGIYADLCFAQHYNELKDHDFCIHETRFISSLYFKCRQTFDELKTKSLEKVLANIKENLQEETDPKRRESLEKLLTEMTQRHERQTLGIVRFFGHLFRVKLLIWNHIDFCLKVFLRQTAKDPRITPNDENRFIYFQSKDEVAVKCYIVLLQIIGLYVQEQDDLVKLDVYVDLIIQLKDSSSNCVKFMIMDLEELRNKRWNRGILYV